MGGGNITLQNFIVRPILYFAAIILSVIFSPSVRAFGAQTSPAISIQTAAEPPGEHCIAGGVKIEILQNGKVQDAQTQYVCNGRDGCEGGKYRNKAGDCIPKGFIAIPAGTLSLSHPTGKYNKDDTTRISAFLLGETPVTVAQFAQCVKAGGCDDSNYAAASADKYCNYNRGDKFLEHPMNCINFQGAQQYCQWIGGRLPTEEEWEYAATHNGTEHLNVPYPWGSTEPVRCKTGNYLDGTGMGHVNNCRGEDNTSPVGNYSPEGDSPLGLKDMVGNVCEITASSWDQKDDAVSAKGCPWEEAPEDLAVSNRLKQSRSIISTTVSYTTQNTGGKIFNKRTETVRSVKKTTSSKEIIRNTGFRCAK